jgi:carbonic anhydrase
MLKRRFILFALTKVFKQEARFLKELASHPRTPMGTKALLGLAMLYLVSPIDFIPDFIPILGQFDDIIILGGMVVLALMLVPRDLVEECRMRSKGKENQASEIIEDRPKLNPGRWGFRW